MQKLRYEYNPISTRKPLHFPDNKRVALLVYVNIQHFPADVPEKIHALVPEVADANPEILNTCWRDYGLRVGIFRLFDILQKHKVRATANLNLDVCKKYPEIIKRGNQQNWDWVAMSQNSSKFLNKLEMDQEREFITSVISQMEKGTGKRPLGWATPCFAESLHTPDILAESGIEYLCDYTADDQPFPLNVRSGSLISIPYSIEVNDMIACLSKGISARDFGGMIKDQFDVLYQEGEMNGRVLPICIHTFLTGQAFRAKHLDEALKYICSHDDVWLTTAGEINEWYRSDGVL